MLFVFALLFSVKCCGCALRVESSIKSRLSLFKSRFPGAGEPEAESAGGTGPAAGPARALQEVFDSPLHPLGLEPSQRVRTEVTSDARATPLTVKES